MPKQVITEIDYSGAGASQPISTAVFVPGLLGTAAKVSSGSITLCETETEFKSQIGQNTADKSWVIAHQLVKLGLPVYYAGFDSAEALSTALGSDDLWTEIQDRGLYDIRFITLGGLENPTSTIIVKAINAAAGRGDAIALVDHPSSYTKIVGNSGETNTIPLFFNGVKSAMTDTGNLKYAAGFTPWCYCNGIAEAEGITTANYDLPATFIYLGAFAKSLQKNRSWLAAAGSYRGICAFEFEPKVKFGDAAVDALQSRNPEAIGINPICNVRPFGDIVWGNRTLLPNSSTVAGGLVASSFLNIRQLATDIKKTVYNAARKLTFEPNDNLLWSAFCAEVQPILDVMKSGRGINGGRIIRVAASEKATVKARVRVVPIEAVEDFYIQLEMADSLEVVEG